MKKIKVILIAAFLIPCWSSLQAQITTSGTESLVNTSTDSSQQFVRMSANIDGDYIQVWSSNGTDLDDYGIYLSATASNGSSLISERLVNASYTTGSQIFADVALNADRNYVVAWMTNDGGGTDTDGFAIRHSYKNTGGLIYASQAITNTTTAGNQRFPSVAIAKDGQYVIAWESAGDIKIQRYSNAGVASGSETNVNTTTDSLQTYPDVAMNYDGDFVVVWQSTGQDKDGAGIFGQLYDNTGATVGTEFPISTDSTDNQIEPKVAMDSLGNFVVVWSDYDRNSNLHEIYAQRFNSDGTKDGVNFRVNTTTANEQRHPEVSVSPGGNFLVSWTSWGQDDERSAVMLQLYDNDGDARGAETQVNTNEEDYQTLPSVAMSADEGAAIISWQDGAFNSDTTQEGSGYGIYQQKYTIGDLIDPNITSANTASVAEGSVSVLTVVATDANAVSLTTTGGVGLDQSLFEFNDNALQFKAAPDFELPQDNGTDNEYQVEVIASDGVNSTSQLITVTVTDVNDAPAVAVNTGISVDEGATEIIDETELAEGDQDDSGTDITFTVTALPSNGTVQLSSTDLELNDTFTQDDIDNDRVQYVHDGGETTSDSFTFDLADDGADGVSPVTGQTFNITINALNDAPSVVTNTGISLDEGGTEIIGNDELLEGDPDDAGTGITYTVTTLPTNGTLQKSSVDLLVNGTFTQSDLEGNDIQYVHDGGETTSDSFVFDLADGGENGASAVTGQTFNITINALNDAPAVAVNTGTSLDEGGTEIIGNDELLEGDPDDAGTGITYTVTTLPSNGTLQKSSVDLLVNGTFTQSDLEGNDIQYVHDGGETTSDSFVFDLADGGENGASVVTGQTFNITINSLNDAPSVSINTGTSLDEGGTEVIGNDELLEGDPDDAGTGITYTITTLPSNGTLQKNSVALLVNGTFTQSDLEGNDIEYIHDGGETTSDSFVFDLSDGGENGASAVTGQTFNITINAVNDAPIVATNTGISLNEGGTEIINNTELNEGDPDDSGSGLTYTITSLPSNGDLQLNSTNVLVDGTFTQDDIDNNLIQYVHNGGETTSDSFMFDLDDGGEDGVPGVSEQTFSISISSVNDAPVVAINTGITLDEGSTEVINNTELNEGDPDDSGTGLTYTVTTLPVNGDLQLSSVNILADGTFTQDDLDNNRVQYVHDGSETTSDSFIFSLADGGEDGTGAVTGQTFNITVNAANDNTPVITASQVFSVDEDAANTTSVGTVLATDADAGTSFSNWTIESGNTDNIFAIGLTSGELTIDDNTNLDHETTDSYTLSITVSDGTNTSAAVDVTVNINDVAEGITWTGGTSSDWATASNWNPAQVPTSIDDAIIPDVTSLPNAPIVDEDVTVHNLTIQSSGSMDVASNFVKVTTTFDNSGALTVESGASLVLMGTRSGFGLETIKRTQTGDKSLSIIGTPVMGPTVSDLGADWVFIYDNFSQTFATPDGSTGLVIGAGFFAGASSTPYNISLTGEVTSSSVDVPVATGTDNFNLVANPYAAAIEDGLFLANTNTQNNTTGSIYLWDDGGSNVSGLRGGDYIAVNSLGSISTSNPGNGVSGSNGSGAFDGYINSMQGFFVEATNNGFVTFEQSMQVEANNSDGSFYRTDSPETIKLSLSDGIYYNEILVGYLGQATYGQDYSLDAKKFRGNEMISFYSMIDQDEYSIQGLPLIRDESISTMLGFDVKQAGMYRVEVVSMDISENSEVFLKDNETNTLIPLSEASSYAMNLESGTVNDRIELIFLQSDEVLSLQKQGLFKVYRNDQYLEIDFPSDSEEQVDIISLDGKRLFSSRVQFNSNHASIEAGLVDELIYIMIIRGEHVKFYY